MSKPKVKYLYVRDHDDFPVGTFAYKLKKKKNGCYKMSYAYSAFYMKDQFNKIFARDITRGRLENKPLVLFGTDSELLLIHALELAASLRANHWAKKRTKLGHRFTSACTRTAAVLTSACERTSAAAAA